MAESPLIQKLRSLFTKSSAPVPFGYKMVWVAVRSDNADRVAEALGLRSLRRVGWQTGIRAAYVYPQTHVFVTPPVQGWVCIVGLWFDDSVEDTSIKLAALSSQFGEAHSYANHRVVGLAQWILARDGEVVRCYSYLGERGEVMADSGALTDVELTLESKLRLLGDQYPDELDVMKVASAWSYDPTQLTEASASPAFGVLGMPA